MTSLDDSAKGEVERVPLKVVPIYVTPIIEEPAAPEEFAEVVAPRRRPVYVALAAVLVALATVAVHATAVVIASAGDFETGTTLGYVAVGLSILGLLVAIGAVVLGRFRLVAVLAGLVAVLANPLVLLAVLRFLSGMQS